jgi:hypothetical protein
VLQSCCALSSDRVGGSETDGTTVPGPDSGTDAIYLLIYVCTGNTGRFMPVANSSIRPKEADQHNDRYDMEDDQDGIEMSCGNVHSLTRSRLRSPTLRSLLVSDDLSPGCPSQDLYLCDQQYQYQYQSQKQT